MDKQAEEIWEQRFKDKLIPAKKAWDDAEEKWLDIQFADGPKDEKASKAAWALREKAALAWDRSTREIRAAFEELGNPVEYLCPEFVILRDGTKLMSVAP